MKTLYFLFLNAVFDAASKNVVDKNCRYSGEK